MATEAGFMEFVAGQLGAVPQLSYRRMFGEYAVYVGAKVVALVCDNQFFLKPTAAGRALLGSPAARHRARSAGAEAEAGGEG